MKTARYRNIARHYRAHFWIHMVGAAISAIAFIACLLLQSAALTIAFACVSVLFAFIACTLRNDYVICRDLADYQDDIESTYHDDP